MAIIFTVDNSMLQLGTILTPERYNPKRKLNTLNTDTVPMNKLVEIVSNNVNVDEIRNTSTDSQVVNTGDVSEGVIRLNKENILKNKSNKKIVLKGDILISRLRPYLRQVGIVDSHLYNETNNIYVSSEFLVLRSLDGDSISFLIPYLLSKPVQKVFYNSVEGSQHPRFKENDLLNLDIPEEIITNKVEISKIIESSIDTVRKSEIAIQLEIEKVDNSF
ncbi:MAG: hypothetical protein ACTH52_06580 [Lactococcus cremoris]